MKQLSQPRHDSTAEPHPSPEVLRAYHEDRLPPSELEVIREHLADCSQCAGLMLELSGLAGRAAEAELSDLDVRRAWRKVQQRLLNSGGQRTRSRRSRTWRGALAAVLLAAVAALFLLRQITLDDVSSDGRTRLKPLSATRGTQASSPCTTLSPATSWQLLLPARREPELQVYVLRILTADRAPMATFDLGRFTAGGFAIELPSSDLPPGRYQLQLVGQGAEPTLIEQYCLVVSGG